MNNTVTTPIDICNLALKMLGEPFPINSMSPNGFLPERTCFLNYHPCRREVLTTNRWKFATRTVNLKAETESAGEYAFTLPLDCLHIWEPADVMVRGRALICDTPEITLVYCADVEDVTAFDQYFIKAFATRLACKLCKPLLNSTKMQPLLDNEYHSLI